MLIINVEPQDFFDDATQRFVVVEPVTLHLEHSLVAVSKWESIHKVPFLGPNTDLKGEPLFDYLQCMVIDPDVDASVIRYASGDNLTRLQEYISSTETATTFRKTPEGGPKEIITSELVYFWMNHYKIPMDAENWHLNRLFTLIRIHGVKNQPAKNRSPGEIAAERRALNAARQQQYA
jgi:hypothetical protein